MKRTRQELRITQVNMDVFTKGRSCAVLFCLFSLASTTPGNNKRLLLHSEDEIAAMVLNMTDVLRQHESLVRLL